VGTYILVNGRESFVNVDLLTLCPELGFTDVTIGNAQLIRIDYVPSSSPPATVGCALLDAVVNNYAGGGDVVIFALTATDSVGGKPLSERGGAHVFVAGEQPGTLDSAVAYDVTLCDGAGYVAYDGTGACIAMPRPVLLFHELAHATHLLSGSEATQETLAIQDENLFRASVGLPQRAGHDGSCFTAAQAAGRCPTNPNATSPPPAGTSTGTAECFVATAAAGGPDSPKVSFLRRIRDEMLMQTRWGRAFFAEFYRHYSRFSPAVAAEMQTDPAYRDNVAWGLVTPLLNYLRLVVTRPDWEVNAMPAELRTYLDAMGRDIDDWLRRVPLPEEFASLSAEAAAVELSVFLGHILRTSESRDKYLGALESHGQLPLRGDGDSLRRANFSLVAEDVSFDDRFRVLGPFARVDTAR
jgi:hypothetical protein